MLDLALAGRREEAERLLAEAPAPAARGCWRAPLSIARTHAEVLLGGNDTAVLLQLLCLRGAASEGREGLDVLASVVAADGGASALDARGRDAAKLVDLFWRAYPEAALVLRGSGSGFEYARAEGVDGPVTRDVAERLAAEDGRILLPPPSEDLVGL